ncbi:hypothetical protein KHS38_09755 [Mucilaginibacter sp. Bleaf8]|uniref:hypothetical protein n=1 Tax=Mucilaginibacter sp. Bleaf8 TaxID=2834430 RepID=UPI001BCC8E2F|nr:hypothetical protein [Mucilaginibacter sp. Bleaf8]MBS7564688.1 hypothetical protein [Mucilaginibacter sp. Bleaf8]
MLTNQKLWGNVADNHLQVVYEPSAGLSVAGELQFLDTYKEQIIQQLRCIHNTTVFETDVLFLAKCFHMLQTSYQKVEERYEHVISNSYRYRIAS